MERQVALATYGLIGRRNGAAHGWMRRRRPLSPPAVRVGESGVQVRRGPDLTWRQVEILECIAGGYSNRTIGEELGLATDTIKKEVTALLEAIGAGNRAALAAWWVELDTRMVVLPNGD